MYALSHGSQGQMSPERKASDWMMRPPDMRNPPAASSAGGAPRARPGRGPAMSNAISGLGQVLDLQHFQARVLQEALDQATISFWLRRAAALSASLPRPDDFVGHSSREEMAAREARIRRELTAVQRHVWLLQHTYREPTPDVWEALRNAQ